MIVDQLESPMTEWLSLQSDVFAEAFAWLRSMPEAPAYGITELRGRPFYVNVMSYDTKPVERCRWESHRHTIDIQYIFGGGEAIDFQHPGVLTPNNDYDADGDVEFWQPTTSPVATVLLTPGTYVVFWAGEPHRPQGISGAHTSVHKAVMKIDARLLD